VTLVIGASDSAGPAALALAMRNAPVGSARPVLWVAPRLEKPVPAWLSELAEELRDIDRRRRLKGGLSLADAARYRALVARLGQIIGTKSSPKDQREFLRVPHPATVLFHAGGELRAGLANDFGGGGMSMTSACEFRIGDRIALERAMVGDGWLRLQGGARVVWRAPDGGPGAGLAFEVDSPAMREQIDRVFYRVLDLYFSASGAGLADDVGAEVSELATGETQASAPPEIELVETLRRAMNGK
jgi:hypothetical protein